MNGIGKIRKRWKSVNSMAGVGLDPVIDRIPKEVWDKVGGKTNISEGIFRFNKEIIDVTNPFVVDYKVNANFYIGERKLLSLYNTFDYLKKSYPNILRICDIKFADVGNTSEKVAEEIFGVLDADGVVLNPYLGIDALRPFLKWKNKLVILCVKTSNPSACEIQDIKTDDDVPLWHRVLSIALTDWNYNGNIIPILSATHEKDLMGIREIIGQVPILLAGVGLQGGSIDESLKHCLDNEGYGVMISASRSIIYPERKDGELYTDASIREIKKLKRKINNAKKGIK